MPRVNRLFRKSFYRDLIKKRNRIKDQKIKVCPDINQKLDQFIWGATTSTISIKDEVPLLVDKPISVVEKDIKNSDLEFEREFNKPVLVSEKKLANPKGAGRKCFIFWDLETTGISTKTAKIVQIAAVFVDDFDKELLDTKKFCTLINPGIPIPWQAQNVHGISDEKVKDAPQIRETLEKLRDFCMSHVTEEHNALVFVGHNSWRYDDVILERESRESFGCSFVNFLRQKMRVPQILSQDTLVAGRLAKKMGFLESENLKLEVLYTKITGNELKGSHDALIDASAVIHLAKYPQISRFLTSKPFGS